MFSTAIVRRKPVLRRRKIRGRLRNRPAVPVLSFLLQKGTRGRRADCQAGLFEFDDAIRTLRSIKDDREQADVGRRLAELEQQKRETAQARSSLQK